MNSIKPSSDRLFGVTDSIQTRLETNISNLPVELFQRIFRLAGKQSVQNLAMTSKTIRPIITQTVIDDVHFYETRQFVRDLISLLSMPSQIEPMEAILDFLEHPPVPTLLHFKRRLLDVKERLICELEKLPKAVLASLSRVTPPDFFENIFIVANIRLEIESARTNRSEFSPVEFMILGDLMDADNLSDAVVLAQMIAKYVNDRSPHLLPNHSSVLDKIAVAMANAGKFTDAITLTRSLYITHYFDMPKIVAGRKVEYVLSHAGGLLARSGKFDEIVSFIQDLSPAFDPSDVKLVLLKIVKSLVGAKEFDKAFKFALMIPDEVLPNPKIESTYRTTFFRHEAMSIIANALVEAGQYSFADRVIDELPIANMLVVDALGNFMKTKDELRATILVKKGKVKDAVALALLLPESYEQYKMLRHIASVFIQDKKFDDARAIAHMASDKYYKRRILDDVVEALDNVLEKSILLLASDKKFGQAILLVDSLSISYRQEYALWKIAPLLAQDKKFTQAMEIARRITSETRKSQALESIIKELGLSQRYEDAYALIHEIPDEDIKWRAVASLAVALSEAKKYNFAYRIAITILDNRKQWAALEAIILAFMNDKRYDEAQALFDRLLIDRMGNKERIRRKMALTYARAGNFDKAIEIASTFSRFPQESILNDIIKLTSVRKKTG